MTFLLALFAVFLLLYSLLRIWLGTRLRLEQRVQEIRRQHMLTDADGAQVKAEAAQKKAKAARWNVSKKIERELEQVGIRLTRQEWTVVGLVVLTLLVLAYLLQHSVLGPVFLLILLIIGYKGFLNYHKTRRIKKFEEGLGEAIASATGALKAGYSLFQAMDTVAKETKGQVSEEFTRILKEISLGVAVEDALAHAQERVRSRDFDLIVNAILIHRQVGGNLAEVLDIVADTIRERFRMRGEIRTLTAQGRLSMWIFILMTPIIALALFLFNPSYMSALWSSKAGLPLLLVALLGQIFGALIIRRIVRFDL